MHTITDTIIDVQEGTSAQGLLNLANRVRANIAQVTVGHEDSLVTPAVFGLLSGRPVAFTGVPGTAKTLTAKALARSIGGSYTRVQCVADLLPKDFTGFNWFNQATGQWEFRAGPFFSNVVLLDELTRAPGKTHSGLIEALEEKTVTVDGATYDLPTTQVVIGTWNPAEHAGAETLPDAIRDRFDFCSVVSYPTESEEWQIAVGDHDDPNHLAPVITPEDILQLQAGVRRIIRATKPGAVQYAVSIVRNSRESSRFSLGASPRAAKSLMRMAACSALIHGSEFVREGDIRAVAVGTLRHRVEINYESFETALLANEDARRSSRTIRPLTESEYIDQGITELL